MTAKDVQAEAGASGAAAEPPPRGGSRLRRALGLSFGASLAVQGLGALTGILIARELGPAARGELAAILVWPTLIASVGSLGLFDSVTYAMAKRERPGGSVAGSALAITLVQGLLLVGVAELVAVLVLGRRGHEVLLSAALCAAVVPFYLLTALASSILQGLQAYKLYFPLRLLVPLLTAAGLSGLLATDALDVRAAAGVYVGVYATTAVIGAALVFGSGVRQLAADRRTAGALLRYGLRSHTSFIATTGSEQLDQLALSLFFAPVKLGLYVVAITMTSAVALIGSSASVVGMPHVAGLEARAQQVHAARRLARLTLALTGGAAVVLIAVTPQLLDLLFGHEFADAATPARILLVAAIFLATSRMLAATLRGLGRPLDAGIADGIGLVTTVVALGILLPTMGITGAALASLVGYGTAFVWMAIKTSSVLEIPASSLWLPARPVI